MMDINRFEFIKKIRDVGCEIRHIAILSGNWTEKQMSEAEALGCRIFHKPFSVVEMKDWVLSLEYWGGQGDPYDIWRLTISPIGSGEEDSDKRLLLQKAEAMISVVEMAERAVAGSGKA